MNPAGATFSTIYATTGARQGGNATIGGNSHAGLWSGTAASFLDIHPSGASQSSVKGMMGQWQVGQATFGGKDHAGIWNGKAATFVDLHAYLPADYDTSSASAVWSDDTIILVAGSAHSVSAGRDEAMLWKFAPNAPTLAVAGKKKITTSKAKIALKGTASGAVTSVTAKFGRKTLSVNGTTSWKLTLALKPGKNIVTIVAHGPGGGSVPVKVVVIRR